MFAHLYQYRIRKLMRSRSLVFWTGLFPIILGTLYYVSFGHTGNMEDEFSEIPVAIVLEEETEEAQNVVSILEEIKTEDTIQAILVKNPQAVQTAAEVLMEDADFVEQISFNGEEYNFTIAYFYALIAMAVGYGSFFGMANAEDIQADKSAEAARRSIAPVHKLKAVLADFLAALTVQFILFLIVYGYIQYVLGMDFNIGGGYVVLIGLAGSMVGVSWGYFVGIFPGISFMLRDGILTVSTLFTSFLAGLMVGDMKQTVEEHCPIINRINPPSLISDAFYYAGIYDDYGEYYRCIITLAIIAALLCVGAYLGMRRQRYASL